MERACFRAAEQTSETREQMEVDQYSSQASKGRRTQLSEVTGQTDGIDSGGRTAARERERE